MGASEIWFGDILAVVQNVFKSSVLNTNEIIRDLSHKYAFADIMLPLAALKDYYLQFFSLMEYCSKEKRLWSLSNN